MKKRKNATQKSFMPALQGSLNTSAYTCLLHPEVISDKSGKCPKCGKELVRTDR